MLDVALVQVSAGKGGDGKVSFRREKFVPKGGPDGGDGGNGGSVYLVADTNLRTLDNFAARQVFTAEAGIPGSKRKRHGANGEDLFISVPVGTVIYKLSTSQPVPSKHKAMSLLRQLKREQTDSSQLSTTKQHYQLDFALEIIDKDKPVLIARGGTGGRGNTAFKSPSNQAPENAEWGQPGESHWLVLELKLLADVGLVGLPNAGKSTLLSVMTAAKPKIADYAFTTLEPNLGIMKTATKLAKNIDRKELVIADIPGLIEGASEGKGLGDDFLRHIERCKILVHVVAPQSYLLEQPDACVAQMVADYQVIRRELEDYSPLLAQKSEIVVINKTDLLPAGELDQIVSAFAKTIDKQPMLVSGVTTTGVQDLMEEMWQKTSL